MISVTLQIVESCFARLRRFALEEFKGEKAKAYEMRLNKKVLIILGVFLAASAAALNIFLNSIYRLPVLTYHHIDYTFDKKDRMTVSPEVFAKQMKYLHDRRYNVIPLEKAVWYIDKRTRPPSKTVALTIDDGYEDNYRYAYPVLKKYNIAATIFVIVGLVGRDGFMNWDEIKELSRSGVVGIESHTKRHKWLTGLDDETLKIELEDSKRILEERLRKEIKFLSYPMGGYDERVKLAAKAAGYKAAFATKPTRIAPNYDIYEIKRVRVSSTANNLFVFTVKASGYHAFFRVFSSDRKKELKVGTVSKARRSSR